MNIPLAVQAVAVLRSAIRTNQIASAQILLAIVLGIAIAFSRAAFGIVGAR